MVNTCLYYTAMHWHTIFWRRILKHHLLNIMGIRGSFNKIYILKLFFSCHTGKVEPVLSNLWSTYMSRLPAHRTQGAQVQVFRGDGQPDSRAIAAVPHGYPQEKRLHRECQGAGGWAQAADSQQTGVCAGGHQQAGGDVSIDDMFSRSSLRKGNQLI